MSASVDTKSIEPPIEHQIRPFHNLFFQLHGPNEGQCVIKCIQKAHGFSPLDALQAVTGQLEGDRQAIAHELATTISTLYQNNTSFQTVYLLRNDWIVKFIKSFQFIKDVQEQPLSVDRIQRVAQEMLLSLKPPSQEESKVSPHQTPVSIPETSPPGRASNASSPVSQEPGEQIEQHPRRRSQPPPPGLGPNENPSVPQRPREQPGQEPRQRSHRPPPPGLSSSDSQRLWGEPRPRRRRVIEQPPPPGRPSQESSPVSQESREQSGHEHKSVTHETAPPGRVSSESHPGSGARNIPTILLRGRRPPLLRRRRE